MLARVIIGIVIVFVVVLCLVWQTYENPKQALKAMPSIGRWIALIILAAFLTVAALGAFYTVEHQI